MARIRFLSLANVATLEVQTGALAASAPWTLVCKLVGALGPVATPAARQIEASCVQSVAETLRTQSVGGQTDGALAHHLRSNLLRASLPRAFRAHGATPEELSDELVDSFSYKTSTSDRQAVEQKRVDCILPW